MVTRVCPPSVTRANMRLATALFTAVVALPVPSEETVVSKSAIWQDTVRRGEMVRQVRGLGEITDRRSAVLRIAQTLVKEIQPGQEVSIEFREKPTLAGKVTRVNPPVFNGVVNVDVRMNVPLPRGLDPGLEVDGAILIERLLQVTYVGRPVSGTANGEATLFKIDPDGTHATRVKVRFGRSSAKTIEVVDGLKLGDRVILSDMSAYKGQSRIRLQ
jgi:HlyD family secretion protein